MVSNLLAMASNLVAMASNSSRPSTPSCVRPFLLLSYWRALFLSWHCKANWTPRQQTSLLLTDPIGYENRLLYFEWSPPWHYTLLTTDGYIASTSPRNCLFVIYTGIDDGIPFCTYSGIPSDTRPGTCSGILSDINSGILRDIFSDILWHSFWHKFWRCNWHVFWHTIWQIFWHYLTQLLTFFLAFFLSGSALVPTAIWYLWKRRRSRGQLW